MGDPTDDLIEALARAREAGITRQAAADLVRDVWAAPWSRDCRRPRQRTERTAIEVAA